MEGKEPSVEYLDSNKVNVEMWKKLSESSVVQSDRHDSSRGCCMSRREDQRFKRKVIHSRQRDEKCKLELSLFKQRYPL